MFTSDFVLTNHVVAIPPKFSFVVFIEGISISDLSFNLGKPINYRLWLITRWSDVWFFGLTKNTKMIRFNFQPSKYHFHNPQISLSSLAIPTMPMAQTESSQTQHKNNETSDFPAKYTFFEPYSLYDIDVKRH